VEQIGKSEGTKAETHLENMPRIRPPYYNLQTVLLFHDSVWEVQIPCLNSMEWVGREFF